MSRVAREVRRVRVGRWLGLAALAAMAVGGGCAFGKKPYADDPLLTPGRGRWGDRERAHQPIPAPDAEPAVPEPPSRPLVAVTSRPGE